MHILGIETSCDETAASVVETAENGETSQLHVLSSIVSSSLALHAQTGGIIPETAAREQLKYMIPVLTRALNQAFGEVDLTNPPIDAIALTYGPGLIGSLLVGVETARTLSYLWNKPLIPVNHLLGHIYANWLVDSGERSALRAKRLALVAFPAIALVVSGGHTDLVLLKNHTEYTVLGGTRDDAAGEAFDKIGRLLGLPYPAGPVISKLAENGNPKAFSLPRPMLHSDGLDFSFSGLKTAVLNLTKQNELLAKETLQRDKSKMLADICASVEQAIVDVLVAKTIKAAKIHHATSLLLGGGVAANTLLRQTLSGLCSDSEVNFFVPAKKYCTDNAAMIAAAAVFNNNQISWREITADPELYY